MGRTLGINDDYWHFIFPFFATIIVFGLVSVFVQNPIEQRFWIVIFYLSIFFIQFLYEWTQAVDPLVEQKYNGWENFQKNSRRDIRLFVLGLFLGLIVAIVLQLLFLQ